MAHLLNLRSLRPINVIINNNNVLRCSPSVSHAALDSFDELLRTGLSYLTNCDLSDSE